MRTIDFGTCRILVLIAMSSNESSAGEPVLMQNFYLPKIYICAFWQSETFYLPSEYEFLFQIVILELPHIQCVRGAFNM